jgi:hypothetical protein
LNPKKSQELSDAEEDSESAPDSTEEPEPTEEPELDEEAIVAEAELVDEDFDRTRAWTRRRCRAGAPFARGRRRLDRQI